MAKFLDLTGLTQYTTKIKAWADGLFLKKSEYTAPTIQIVKVNGSPLSPDGSKAVNIDLSTYAIKTEVTQEIAQAVSGITSFEAQVVEELPGTGTKGILYLVANSGSGQNVYDEYLWVTDKYEKLGTREIDLSQYALKSEIPTNISQLTNDSGFISEVPAEYVTDEELAAKGYQTAAQVESAITSKGYLDAVPEEYVTDTELTEKGYQTSSQVSEAINAALPTAIESTEIDALFE